VQSRALGLLGADLTTMQAAHGPWVVRYQEVTALKTQSSD
jgi:hypothetical protein